jgi:hypothetical protein
VHLTERTIRRYLDGHRDPGVERHLRVCVSCASRAGVRAADCYVWRRRGLLGRHVRDERPGERERRLRSIVDDARRAAN